LKDKNILATRTAIWYPSKTNLPFLLWEKMQVLPTNKKHDILVALQLMSAILRTLSAFFKIILIIVEVLNLTFY